MKLFVKTRRFFNQLMLAMFVFCMTAVPAFADPATMADALTVDISANEHYLYESMVVVMGIAVLLFIFRKNKGIVKYG